MGNIGVISTVDLLGTTLLLVMVGLTVVFMGGIPIMRKIMWFGMVPFIIGLRVWENGSTTI